MDMDEAPAHRFGCARKLLEYVSVRTKARGLASYPNAGDVPERTELLLHVALADAAWQVACMQGKAIRGQRGTQHGGMPVQQQLKRENVPIHTFAMVTDALDPTCCVQATQRTSNVRLFKLTGAGPESTVSTTTI